MPERRNRRSVRRVVLVSAALAIALAALPWVLGAGAVRRWLALALVHAAEVATGERVRVGGVLVEPYLGRVTVDGVLVSARSSGDPILALGRAEARFGHDGIRPVLRDLLLEQPVLHLHVDPDGLREFRDALKTGGRARTPWERLTVRDAAVTVDLPDGGFTVERLGLAPTAEPGRYDLTVVGLGLRQGRFEQRAEDFVWRRVAFDLGEVAVPELEVHFPTASFLGTVDLRRDGPLSGSIWVSSDLAAFDPWLLPRRRLEGTLDLDLTLAGTSDKPAITGRLALSPWLLVQAPKGAALGPDEPGKTMSFGALEGGLALSQEADAVELLRLESAWAGGWVGVEGTIGLADGAAELRLAAQGLRLSELLPALDAAPTPWVEVDVDLETDLSGRLKPFSLGGPYRFDTRELRVYDGPARHPGSDLVLGIPEGWFEGEVLVEGGQVMAGIARFEVPGGRASGRLQVGLTPRGPLDVALDFEPIDLAVLAPLGTLDLGGIGRLSAHLWGPFRSLQATGDFDVAGLVALGVPFADRATARVSCPSMRLLSLQGFEAWKGRTRYAGNLDVDFTRPLTLDTQILVRDGTLSDLAGMFVDVPGVEAAVSGTLELQGEPLRLNGSAELALREVEIVGERFPTGGASARLEDGRFTLAGLEVSRQGESESLLVRGTVGRAWESHFELVSDGLRIETLDALRGHDLDLTGRLQVLASASGSLLDPVFSGRMTAAGVRSHGVAAPGSVVRFETGGSAVEVHGDLLGGGALVEGGADWSTGAWGFDVALRRLPVHLARPLAAGGVALEVLVDGAVRVDGQGAAPPDLAADLARVDVRWGERKLANVEPWRFTRRAGAWTLQDVNLAGPATQARIAGAGGPGRALSLAGEGTLDLAWLRLLEAGFLRTGGAAHWRLEVGGTTAAPEVRVDAHVEDGLIRGTWFPHTFEGLEGDLAFGPDGYRIEALRGRVGGGTVEGEGTIAAEAWRPVSYDLAATFKDARLQYLDDLPPMIADARLRFDGPVDELVLGGQIDLQEVVFSERIDWESWLVELEQERLSAAAPEESEDLFSMDIAVLAPGTGRVRNNVGDARLSADLRVVGDTARPGLLGRVWVEDGGRVFLKEREFDVVRGELQFIDPYTFDPELDLLFSSEVSGRSREYQVFYRVTGPFSAWRAEASSEPALSQADINFLLLFGATRAELEEYGELEGALAWEGIDLLSKGLGTGEWLDRLSGGDTFLDRIDITTGTATQGARSLGSEPRLVVEKDLGAPWDLTLAGEWNMVRPEDWYGSVEKRIARRLYLTAYYASVQYERSLTLGGAFGAEFKLRWEVE